LVRLNNSDTNGNDITGNRLQVTGYREQVTEYRVQGAGAGCRVRKMS